MFHYFVKYNLKKKQRNINARRFECIPYMQSCRPRLAKPTVASWFESGRKTT